MATRTFTRTMATAAALAVAALVLSPFVSWAVRVEPPSVFLDNRTNTGQVYLTNAGTVAEECTVELRFGYPDTDSAGGIFVRMVDPTPEQPSAAAWIRAFPRRVVVPPGRRQVVRLLATPPAGLPEGEYWTRLVVTSRGAPMAVAGTDSMGRASVALVVSTIIAVNYRNGSVRTGVALDDFRVTVEHDSLIVRLGLARHGNAAFLGTARIQLRDAAGGARGEWDTPMAVYYAINRRLAFPLEGVGPGSYTAHLLVNTIREDIPQSSVLPAPPIERSVAVDVR